MDGILNLTIRNETGTYSSIYTEVFNKCGYKEYFHWGGIMTNPYPLTLQQGGMHTQVFSTCVGDSSAVRWKFSENDPWFQIDSILVKTAAVIFHEIKY
jgi:hypothetical protein